MVDCLAGARSTFSAAADAFGSKMALPALPDAALASNAGVARPGSRVGRANGVSLAADVGVDATTDRET